MNAETQLPTASVQLEGWPLLLILSVREVFETMLGARVAPVCEPSKSLRLEWTAIIGLTGKLQGVLMFSCDERIATRIESKLLGVPIERPDEQTADALGEVCNMIAGNFKHKIGGMSEHCALCPPTVITGKDFRVHRQESGAVHSLPVTFTFEGAPIYVSLEVRK